MWPKRKQKTTAKANTATGDIGSFLERQDRLLADAQREYPDGKTPAGAVEAVLGRQVSSNEARRFLGEAGLIGFSEISKLDPARPGKLLRKYGTGILSVVGWQSLFSEEPVDVAKILDDHEAEPTPTQTTFFREPSMLAFAKDVAGAYQEKVGRRLRIAEVACSNGEETWSLAASLRKNGVDAQIDGFDISTRELAQAQAGGPYLNTVTRVAPEDFRKPYAPYFRTGGEHDYDIYPNDDLRSMASFHELDITTQQLEPNAYDAVLSYNMLWHYPVNSREGMLGNMLSGLRPGGVFMFEGPSGGRDAGSSQEYREWAKDLSRFDLYPHPDISTENDWAAGSILMYNPAQAGSVQLTERI